jgi:phage terminase Nu1 subunit (DNA packaging protein)
MGRPRVQLDGAAMQKTAESLYDASLRKEIALADKHQTAARRDRGELIEKQPAMLLWASIAQTLRDHLLGFPDRVAGECAALTDPRMVRDYLLKEMRLVLKNLPETLHGSRDVA